MAKAKCSFTANGRDVYRRTKAGRCRMGCHVFSIDDGPGGVNAKAVAKWVVQQLCRGSRGSR